MIEVSDIPEGYKRCTGFCRRILPTTEEFFHFYRSARRNGEMTCHPRCKTCNNRANSESKERKKKESLSYTLNGYKPEGTQKRCIGSCGRILPDTSEFFYYRDKDKTTLQTICKRCHNTEYRKRKWLPSASTSTDVIKPTTDISDQCGSCGTTRGNIIGHRHKNVGEIRGYLCSRCLKIVEDAQDDIDKVNKVLVYLKRTQFDKTP